MFGLVCFGGFCCAQGVSVLVSSSFLLSIGLLSTASAQVPLETVPATGVLFVNAPEGAEIFLDGEPTQQQAPFALRGIVAGNHDIRVVLGCAWAEGSVDVRSDGVARLDLSLTPGSGTVSVLSEPAGAQVRVDGTVVGTTPLDQHSVPCGAHTLSLSLDGHTPVEVPMEVGLDQAMSVSHALAPRVLGSLAVIVDPLSAEVSVDGAVVSTGPITLDDIEAGEHVVRARASGFLAKEEVVQVPPDGIVRVDLDLVEKPPFAARIGLDRVAWGRVGINAGVSLVAVAAASLSVRSHTRALAGYASYTELTYADDPTAFYAESVAAPRTASYAWAGVAVLGGAGATALWVTDPGRKVTVQPGVSSVQVTGRFGR